MIADGSSAGLSCGVAGPSVMHTGARGRDFLQALLRAGAVLRETRTVGRRLLALTLLAGLSQAQLGGQSVGNAIGALAIVPAQAEPSSRLPRGFEGRRRAGAFRAPLFQPVLPPAFPPLPQAPAFKPSPLAKAFPP